MSKATPEKDTLYVDVDDEITAIIDKVRSSDAKVVALVLPKRASVLQSIVNMKLLKRTAETAKKHLVLVTTEASLMPLAGNVGLHVASTPTSKPVIPPAPASPSDEPEDIDEPLEITGQENAAEFDPAAAAAMSVGELAVNEETAQGKISPSDIDEEIEMSDDEPVEADVASAGKVKKPKKNKKLSVPNFDSFRKKLAIIAAVVVLLIGGLVYAMVVMPKAAVTVHTDTSTITTNMNISLDTAAKTVDTGNKLLPATAQSQQKSYSQQAAATGQQNNGPKAQGSIRMTATSCAPNISQPNDLPAGTTVTNGGNTYVTQTSATFAINGGQGSCVNYKATNDTTIVALKGGKAYNTDQNVTFAVTGNVTAKGSAVGGDDNIVKVVSQTDIDGAKAKITAQDTSPIKADLQTSLQGKGVQAIMQTFVAGDPQTTTSANAGDAADNVTVTEVITYTMLGVKQSDLSSLVDANVLSQIDKTKQVILDDGVAKATFTEQNPATATGASLAMSAKSIAGPHIDTDAIAKAIVGKKSGEIQTYIKQTPGVTDVEVKYSPFWVNKAPSNVSKITVQVDKANTGKQ